MGLIWLPERKKPLHLCPAYASLDAKIDLPHFPVSFDESDSLSFPACPLLLHWWFISYQDDPSLAWILRVCTFLVRVQQAHEKVHRSQNAPNPRVTS